jgi:hypothetical protein
MLHFTDLVLHFRDLVLHLAGLGVTLRPKGVTLWRFPVTLRHVTVTRCPLGFRSPPVLERETCYAWRRRVRKIAPETEVIER